LLDGLMNTDVSEFPPKNHEKLKIENRRIREKCASLKKALKNLEREFKAQSALFDALPIGIVLVHDKKIAAINETALRELGYERKDCLGKNAFDFVNPEKAGFVEKYHRNRLSGRPAPSQYEVPILKKGGGIVECKIRIQKVRYKGGKGFLVLIIPVAERKRKERERELKQRMEIMRALVAGLNRHLGRDLDILTQHARQMKKISDPARSEHLESLKGIEEAAERISGTARVLNLLSSPQQDPHHRVVFKLNDVIQRVVNRVQPKLRDVGKRRGVSYRLKTYLRADSTLQGNPDEICDVIHHVMLNAVEAMPDGGDIYLSTEENGGYADIYVQDSGVGIPEHLKSRILDPFFTTKEEGRIGLGLSVAHAILQRHGGDIELLSKPGQGTIVSVRMPVAERPLDGNKIRGRRKTGKAHILIVEPIDIMRELLAQALAGKGYRTTRAVSGREGLHFLTKRPVDLLIADDALPDLESAALFRKAGTLSPQPALVLIQSVGEGPHPLSSTAPHVDLLFRKPLLIDQLVREISSLLRGKGW